MPNADTLTITAADLLEGDTITTKSAPATINRIITERARGQLVVSTLVAAVNGTGSRWLTFAGTDRVTVLATATA